MVSRSSVRQGGRSQDRRAHEHLCHHASDRRPFLSGRLDTIKCVHRPFPKRGQRLRRLATGSASRSGYLCLLAHLLAVGHRSDLYAAHNGDERQRSAMHANSMVAAAVGASVLALLQAIFVSFRDFSVPSKSDNHSIRSRRSGRSRHIPQIPSFPHPNPAFPFTSSSAHSSPSPTSASTLYSRARFSRTYRLSVYCDPAGR